MKIIKMSLLSIALLASLGAVNAQTRPTNSDGYLTDSRGFVVKSGTGLCVRTSSYNSDTTFHPDCDTDTTPVADVLPKAAEPEIATVAEPIISDKILSQEILFDFNSAKLTQVGITQLDEVVVELNQVNGGRPRRVFIDGYTDPIGSKPYNIQLSKERAKTVVNYLQNNVTKELIKIFVTANGEYNLKDADCGDKKNVTSIACNAPNRRVEISIHPIELND